MRRLAIIALLLALLALPGGALASTHPFAGVFASGVPQDPPSPLGGDQLFDDPCGLAVDAGGNVFVSVYHGFGYAVARFDASGSFLGRQSDPLATNGPCDLTLAGAPQHLFGAMLHGATYDLTSGAVLDPERSTGIATGPDGRIYVAHRHQVSVYEPDGTAAALTIGAPASLGDAYGVAVDASGDVYVGDAATQTVKVFDPSVDPTTPARVVDGAGTPPGGFSDLTDTDLAIGPSGNLLVVDDLQPELEHPLAAVYEFGPAGEFLGEISHWNVLVPKSATEPEHLKAQSLVHGGPTGVAVAPDGTIYVTSGNEQGGVVYRFAAGSVPTSRLQVQSGGAGEGRVESRIAGNFGVFTGIDCGPICGAEYETGETVTLVATPSPHSAFLGWSVAGQPNACLDAHASCQVTLAGDREVTADFGAVPQRRLHVSVSGQGLLSSTPSGISCRSQCSAEFDQGAEVAFSPEPADGFEFAGFSGACSGRSECRVDLTGDVSVGASFTPSPAPSRSRPPSATSTLLLLSQGSGTGSVTSDPAGLDCGLACSASFPRGTGLALRAEADPGSRFTGWAGCDAVSSGRCALGLLGPRAIVASFAEGPAIELGPLSARGERASLPVTPAEAGRIVLAGKHLRTVRRHLRAGATVDLPLRPARGTRRMDATGTLRTRARIRFLPASEAAPEALTRAIALPLRK